MQDLYENLNGALYVGHNETDGTLHVWHGSRLVNVYSPLGVCIDCYGLDQFEVEETLTFSENLKRHPEIAGQVRNHIDCNCGDT